MSNAFLSYLCSADIDTTDFLSPVKIDSLRIDLSIRSKTEPEKSSHLNAELKQMFDALKITKTN
ncbi:MAG TPA: hypothetical protein ENN55_00075 [Firmicutes bacterium]|nr:hypothetical protein [Bacillota bacterium]